ncbi:pseudouridine synthase [Chromobacterium sp. IIBBL 290-4]|uniref:pseudouridine synthase n=1 Tax=Chromobacterium sp. IIBBL 290-4 TaxID=2953890 RepID=UPI0020B8D48C|nr:pseudouridine synthase [Chromobacterium sp. IIBBL 290-4]UTH72433.1 pseudouridine synthase [Chromobacterium sp. IIBBL 290-4]
MSQLILLNKPYGVICQFSDHPTHPTLKSCVSLPGVYPAGRLDTDSEGLLLLTGDGNLQHRIADPRWKLPKTYWVQVEGEPKEEQLDMLRRGVDLGDFTTLPAQVRRIETPALWPRNPPVRFRKTVPDCWLEIIISEGKNRQVRRMTAKAGLPTLRLVRVAIGPWTLDGLQPGELRQLEVRPEDLPRVSPAKRSGKPASRPQPQDRAVGGKGGKAPTFRFARNKKA